MQKERIAAKNGLESYCFNMKNTMDDEKLKVLYAQTVLTIICAELLYKCDQDCLKILRSLFAVFFSTPYLIWLTPFLSMRMMVPFLSRTTDQFCYGILQEGIVNSTDEYFTGPDVSLCYKKKY